MKESHPNRMAVHRTPPPVPQPAELVDIEQPKLTGIRCPGCGRGMVPRRYGSHEAGIYGSCTLCPARMVMTFDSAGAIKTVRLVKA